jgi:hypothetical protein
MLVVIQVIERKQGPAALYREGVRLLTKMAGAQDGLEYFRFCQSEAVQWTQRLFAALERRYDKATAKAVVEGQKALAIPGTTRDSVGGGETAWNEMLAIQGMLERLAERLRR